MNFELTIKDLLIKHGIPDNFELTIKDLLIKHGIPDNQVDEVLTMIKEDELLADFKERWGDSPSSYPDFMLNVVWRSSKLVALGWIDENIPQAWFRSLFED